MVLADADEQVIEDHLGRDPTRAEAALFENLWSEHCAYRSSRKLLGRFESDGSQVVVGPGDDAAVVSLTDEWYLTLGIESHNHPSYVDPYDGAATGVGGIVRDTLSMGAYPIALADSLYFGEFDAEHSLYLFEGVVEGIADYGNAIGVPTVAGSVQFHEDYTGNPLVNVACVGLVHRDRLVTATAQAPGNRLVLVGNATGRDGLGGASFASEDLAADAETEDRPAVQVGDPYTEKLLIETNEALLDAGVIQSARDLGAAGLGGASSEMVAKGNLGAEIDLQAVHQREPNMTALEILLAESQERMCYEVAPDDVEAVREIAAHHDVGCSVIGTVTDTGRYVCQFDGDTVVDVPATFLGEGAPLYDRPTDPSTPDRSSAPAIDLEDGLQRVLSDPNTASKEWVYRQYDHEVGVRTACRPGDNAAVLAMPETDSAIALTAGAEAGWTVHSPQAGAEAVALEAATNLASKGAIPLAAVDCLNGGNPETPSVFAGFDGIVSGLADMCAALNVPIVGGNVSLYNDSETGPIPPTPTIAMVGETESPAVPTSGVTGGGTLVLVGELTTELGGARVVDSDPAVGSFPARPSNPAEHVQTLANIARQDSTTAVHDVSHGGLAVTLAEMVTADTGVDVSLDASTAAYFSERPGRLVVETTAPASVTDLDVPTTVLGESTDVGMLDITTATESSSMAYGELGELRNVIAATLE